MNAELPANLRRPITIDFCNFGPGYPKTDNFFYHLLRSRFDVRLTDQPEFLLYTNPLNHMHRLHNCVRIYLAIESDLPDWSECDYALTCHYLADPRHLRLPFYVLSGEAQRLVKEPQEAEQVLAQKDRFCSFVVSNHHPRRNRNRADFFHRLSRYKRIDSAGTFLNNLGGPLPRGGDHKVQFLRRYKFNIAFENGSIPGYTTEKIVEAMQARCLPIYWGSPRIHEEFNPRSFLNYYDFPSEEALIERIIELDQDDAKYLAVAREPYFHQNQPNEFFDRERMLNFFAGIFTTPIRPVAERRSVLQLGRWLAVKQNKPHGPAREA